MCIYVGMQNICIVLLIGLPGAGKTTFHTTLNKRFPVANFQVHNVVYDELIDSACEMDYKHKRGKVFATAKSIITSILNLPTHKKHIIIIDDNMYLRSMRYQFYKLAEQLELSFLEVYFDVELETALLRNSTRENRIPEQTIIKMAEQIEKPKENWEQNVCTINSNLDFKDDVYLEFFNKVELSFDKPLKRKICCPVEKMPITKLQAVDLVLRKIIRAKITVGGTNASTLSNRKKEVFKAVKEGKIIIEEWGNESQMFNILMMYFK